MEKTIERKKEMSLTPLVVVSTDGTMVPDDTRPDLYIHETALVGEDDLLFGGDGNDYLHGGAGNDFLDGGSDADHLYVGVGNDIGYGGDGIDTLDGGIGEDEVWGDSAKDSAGGKDVAWLLGGTLRSTGKNGQKRNVSGPFDAATEQLREAA